MIEIKDLTVGSTITNEPMMIYDASIAPTKTGKKYLKCTLGNKSGKLEGRLWTLPNNCVLPKPGEVYAITATVTEFNGETQLNISTMQYKDPEDIAHILEDFTVSVDNPPNGDIANALFAAVADAVKDTPVLDAIYSKFIRSPLHARAFTWTAACNVHHAGMYGWLKHTIEVVRYARSIYKALPEATRKYIRYDILVAGAFFHDVGKLLGYGFENGVSVMTDEGMLLEHPVLGCQIIDDLLHDEYKLTSPEDIRTVLALKHCIASHHEELEWGAPINPVTLEAVIIARADHLSASLDTITQALNERPEGEEWTAKIFTQHNRKFTTFI